jgi:hypothetical protein
MRRVRAHIAVLLTGLGYLAAVTVPCPPDPARLAAIGAAPTAAHHHDSDRDASPVVDAPCECGCDKASGAGGIAKLGPALLRDAPALFVRGAPPPPSATPIWPRDLALPIDPPIPIAA